jgi:pimeloyl-ACP methyl ester carboxylesterase
VTRASFRAGLLRTLALAVLVLLVGVTYQGVATAIERRQFPRPGRLVDVGGHQLHLHCIGKGSPVVVLEAPAAGMSASWGWVQEQLGATTTRVCAYDRAGQGWSENRDGYSMGIEADELHALLAGGGERGPFVVAGAGLGASLATIFASRFPKDVTALVLVDEPRAEEPAARGNALTHISALSPWLARAGLLRASRALGRLTDGLPEPSAGALKTFLNRPDHLTRAVEELSRWSQITTTARQAPMPPSVLVTRLEVIGGRPVAFLASERDASLVTAALRNAVQHRR